MKTHKQKMQELKEKDPQMYAEIQKEVKEEQQKRKEKQKLGIKLVPVKDSEGYYTKKYEDEVTKNETIISENEYKQAMGHGGARSGAGRKKKFENPKKATFEFEEKTLVHLKDYAKKHKKSQNELINEAIERFINEV